jgi:hypothetical protein
MHDVSIMRVPYRVLNEGCAHTSEDRISSASFGCAKPDRLRTRGWSASLRIF